MVVYLGMINNSTTWAYVRAHMPVWSLVVMVTANPWKAVTTPNGTHISLQGARKTFIDSPGPSGFRHCDLSLWVVVVLIGGGGDGAHDGGCACMHDQ